MYTKDYQKVWIGGRGKKGEDEEKNENDRSVAKSIIGVFWHISIKVLFFTLVWISRRFRYERFAYIRKRIRTYNTTRIIVGTYSLKWEPLKRILDKRWCEICTMAESQSAGKKAGNLGVKFFSPGIFDRFFSNLVWTWKYCGKVLGNFVRIFRTLNMMLKWALKTWGDF